MTFKEIKGNKRLIDDLISVIENKNVHHAYIIEGPWSAEKNKMAIAFAQALLCKNNSAGCGTCPTCRKVAGGNHIDITIVKKEASKGSKVESVKDAAVDNLQVRLKTKPYDGDRNIAIVQDADTMTLRAYNRLLKTLEEPPLGTVIIMLSENIESLPQTIRSRAIHLRMESEKESGSKSAMKKANELVQMMAEREPYYKVKKVVEPIAKERDKAYVFLDCLEEVYREKLLDRSSDMKKEYIYSAVEAVENARRDITRKINTTYSLKCMVLTIGG